MLIATSLRAGARGNDALAGFYVQRPARIGIFSGEWIVLPVTVEAIVESQPYPMPTGRELELELARVRAEATAARMEARAAELELMLIARNPPSRSEPLPAGPQSGWGIAGQGTPALAKYDHQPTNGTHSAPRSVELASGHQDAAESLIQAIRRLVEGSSASAGQPDSAGQSVSRGPFTTATLEKNDWEARLSGLRGRDAEPVMAETSRQPASVTGTTPGRAASIEQFAGRIAMASQTALETPPEDAIDTPLPRAGAGISSVQEKSIRVDAASEPVKRPGMMDSPAMERSVPERSADRQAASELSPKKRVVGNENTAGFAVEERTKVAKPSVLSDGRRPLTPQKPIPIPVSIAAVAAGEEKPKRWRPAGWLISTTAHVAGLLALGLLSLANPKPKDQLAFTASVSEASETAVESFTIESAEEMPEVTEPTMAETAADVSDLGTLRMVDLSLDSPTVAAPPMPAMSGDTSSKSMKLAKAAFKGDTLSKVQFAGLDGGGNHFVYLVDSSNSMKKFNDARSELLRSIDSLKPEQRFYVVFYDESPKYMRVANPSQDEPASVYATPENKQRFRRWAMAVQQARGQSPPEVLKFAFKLRPDVIFLLSDGEFTAQTETVIRENNFQENLFGESGPISIIHTIRYPGVSTTEGRQAETQMQRIAAENGGQYRNVEIP